MTIMLVYVDIAPVEQRSISISNSISITHRIKTQEGADQIAGYFSSLSLYFRSR